ncbi:MAG: hypothetical protein GC168_20850 [Candidatus Hydrogenedens sp.]|nr:hypothetical protein [Candidatus Hydrogenedens sp.]
MIARAALLLLALFGVSAVQADDLADWPRRDVLEIQPVTDRVKAILQESDFVVDAEHPPYLRVHASAEDRRELDALGITYLVVGQEPNPPKFDKAAELGQYHSHADMTTRLQNYANAFPGIARLVNVGNSIQGRALWAMHITDNPDTEEDEPEFKYVSSMHGDEPVGMEMCLYLIDLLLNSYGQESVMGARLTNLIDTTDIWILPLMNPDGHNAGSRGNFNGYDLNRNFPSYVLDPAARGTIYDGVPLNDAGRQTETRLVMAWTAAHSFVSSANIHTGSLVVNYPFDEPASAYTSSADDALFVDISLRYASNNPPMYASPSFDDGITNGAAWYTVYGGMQDWHYRYMGCNEVTLELSNIKKPSQSTLATYWENNRESMLQYMEAVHLGVRGVVTDAVSGDPVYAKIVVDANTQPVFTDPDVGDYHRMLLPGTYSYTISAPGYEDTRVENVAVGTGNAIRTDVELMPILAHSADANRDREISLTELLRIVQFFNALTFQCDADSEDGYAPYGGSCFGCAQHSSDYAPRDCAVSLSELLRGVQLFNLGTYHPCEAGEGDGFCPGA